MWSAKDLHSRITVLEVSEALQAVCQMRPELIVAEGRLAVADDLEVRRQAALAINAEKRRDQLTLRQSRPMIRK